MTSSFQFHLKLISLSANQILIMSSMSHKFLFYWRLLLFWISTFLQISNSAISRGL